MPETLRIQAQFKRVGTTDPEERFVNTWWFSAPDKTNATKDLFADIVNDFYTSTTVPGNATTSIGHYMSGVIDRTIGACKIKTYAMSDPAPREPRTIDMSVLAATTDPPLPAEVAVTLSFYATRNTPKRRGRVYIGPLDFTAVNSSGSTDDRVPSALRGHLTNAAKEVQVRAKAAGGLWIVNSSDPFLTEIQKQVTHAWVDDAFDTQRRRGVLPSTRTTLAFNL